MSLQTSGIHHITAIVGHPKENFSFYTKVLGLRLVKKTVNFDQPDVYHLYYGNEVGEPGTLLTFFPLLKGIKRRPSEVAVTSFAVPTDSFTYWEDRLSNHNIHYHRAKRFGREYLSFVDPHGIRLELVQKETNVSPWCQNDIPNNLSICGFAGLTLKTISLEETSKSLTEILGMTEIGRDEGYVRFRATAEVGNEIDVIQISEEEISDEGFVHHVAWRAKNVEELEKWAKHVSTFNSNVTQLKDRNYFTSIYFRETDTILHEIATDPPGFAVDEPKELLGNKLMLPVWLEKDREKIEKGLPVIK